MNYNTIHLVYFSPTHTSQDIILSIAEGTGIINRIETDLTYENLEGLEWIEDALTIIAVPVYGGRVAEIAMERLQNIRGKNSPVIPVVLYGNRDYEDALLELCDFVKGHGFTPVAGAAFVGEHSFSRADKPIAAGRPDESDRKIAFDLGRAAVDKLKPVDSLSQAGPLVVKGQLPYKVKGSATPATPVTISALCVQCGCCIEICPAQVIELQDEIISAADGCIKCCACVKFCPNGARIFNTPYTDMLFKNFSTRREPELFI